MSQDELLHVLAICKDEAALEYERAQEHWRACGRRRQAMPPSSRSWTSGARNLKSSGV
jgi:hypothetical protein